MNSLFTELKRRNVFRVAVLYVVTAWLVLQVADVLIPYFSVPDWAFRLIVILAALGFIPALVFSWAYELTPEGLKRESEIDRSQSVTPVTARRIDILIAGLLVVLIGVVLGSRFFPRPEISEAPLDHVASAGADEPQAPGANERSIAVLPFVNMSTDAEQEYFSDGLAESLLHLLAQVKGLRVAARTSSFQFKDQTGHIADIGEALNVAHVLEGSVQRAGDTVRVTAQLIKVEDGFHLWSGTYDRTLDNVFAIQDEIARHVADALEVALLGNNQQQPLAQNTSIEAYDQYLLGRQQVNIDSFESMERALGHFQRSLEMDPDYLPTQTAIAETYYLMGNTGLISQTETIRQIEANATVVIERDPGNGRARALLGIADFMREFPTGTGIAEREFKRALELAPQDALVLGNYARYLGYNAGNPIPMMERALSIDPMSAQLMSRLSMTATRHRDFEAADRWGKRLATLHPGNPNANWALFLAHWDSGDLAVGLQYGLDMLKDDPSDFEGPASVGILLLDLELMDEAVKQIELAESIGPARPLPTFARMALQYRQGNRDKAGEMAFNALTSGLDGRHWGPDLMFALGAEYALRSGRLQDFLQAAESWDPSNTAGSDIEHWGDYWTKTALLPVVRAAGDHVRADAIRRNARQFLTKLDPILKNSAHQLALELDAGDTDAAAAEYRRMIDNGYYAFWWLWNDLTLQPIYDHPDVVEARGKLRAEIDRLRGEAEQVLSRR